LNLLFFISKVIKMEALIDQLNKDRPQTTKGLETYLENWNKDEFYNTLTQKDIDGIVKKLDDLNASSIIFICKILGIKNCRALKTSTQDRKNLIKENLEHYLQNQVLKPKNKFVPWNKGLTMKKSPAKRQRSPVRTSRSPVRRTSRSPVRRTSRSPLRTSRSPLRTSRSPLRTSRSPVRRTSRSPVRRTSRSPVRRTSRSPLRTSRSPKRRQLTELENEVSQFLESLL
jgi:hypothetical protein